ncbi:efflux RND transporter periplasmic adaptor subunit [Crenothrix sp.]|uniref:efflux RND transporter periplasmic adaptor subunit n=1 Tax=Crenothrix sp. TaxID=3100433 RepID=UPI00374CA5C4
MMKFKLPLRLLCVSATLLTACSAEQAQEAAPAEVAAIAKVQTQKLRYADMSATLTVYGSVVPLSNTLQTLTVPYASRIDNVYVTNGQTVKMGDPLLSLQPSEDALLVVKQAQQDLAAVKQEHQLLLERVQLKLATQHDVVISQLRVDQSKALIQDLTARGSMKAHTFKATQAGVISLVTAQEGQRIPAGSPLLQWVAQDQLGVSLGVEPENFAQLHNQQPVSISPVNRPHTPPINAHIELINQQIDPLTHLLSVLVKPAAKSILLLNEAVQAQINLASKQALIAPRSAVLPDGDAYSVFTVVSNHAVKHTVQMGLETSTDVEVIDPTLKADDDIVVLGNYELQDGMAVEVKQP